MARYVLKRLDPGRLGFQAFFRRRFRGVRLFDGVSSLLCNNAVIK